MLMEIGCDVINLPPICNIKIDEMKGLFGYALSISSPSSVCVCELLFVR